VKFGSLQPIEIIFPLVAENSELTSKSDEASESSQHAPESREDAVRTESKEEVSHEAVQVSQPEVTGKPKLNILEVLKGMGSAFQLLIRQPNLPEGDSRSDGQVASESSEKLREQAEALRSEINKRSGQLQKVVAAAIEANKDKDLVVKKILENLQNRLGQAKQRADKILKEPESGELAVRTLHSINQGMGNLGSLVQHVLSRVNISINFDIKDGSKNGASSKTAALAASSPPQAASDEPAASPTSSSSS
jgi:hypothetical protein